MQAPEKVAILARRRKRVAAAPHDCPHTAKKILRERLTQSAFACLMRVLSTAK